MIHVYSDMDPPTEDSVAVLTGQKGTAVYIVLKYQYRLPLAVNSIYHNLNDMY